MHTIQTDVLSTAKYYFLIGNVSVQEADWICETQFLLTFELFQFHFILKQHHDTESA